jgi:hypothetical protein
MPITTAVTNTCQLFISCQWVILIRLLFDGHIALELPEQNLVQRHTSSSSLTFRRKAADKNIKLISPDRRKNLKNHSACTSRPMLNNKNTTPNSAIAFVPWTWRMIERP